MQQKNIRLTEMKAEEQRLSEELKRENEALELAMDTRSQLANEYLSVRQLLADKRKPLQEMEAANEEAKNTLDALQKKIASDKSALETLALRLQDARVQAETANTQRQLKSERMQQLDSDLGRLQAEFNADADEHEKLEKTIESSRCGRTRKVRKDH